MLTFALFAVDLLFTFLYFIAKGFTLTLREKLTQALQSFSEDLFLTVRGSKHCQWEAWYLAVQGPT